MSPDLFASLAARLPLVQGIRRKSARRRSGARPRHPHHLRARFEALEPRLMLTTRVIDVGTTADTVDIVVGTFPNQVAIVSEPYSLREAIIEAHNTPEDTVIINLQAGATYAIARDTVQFTGTNFLSSEGLIVDPLYGDFDISRDIIINGNDAIIDANGLGRILQITAGANVTLNDMRITGGVAPGSGSEFRGGAIYVSGGVDLTLDNVTFDSNRSISVNARGGALYADNDGGTIRTTGGTTFINNHALGVTSGSNLGIAAGGAIYLDGGNLDLTATRFDLNQARGDAAAVPGATGAAGSGGAIYVSAGDVVVDNAEFFNNRALAGDGALDPIQGGNGGIARGGAIFLNGAATLHIADTEFRMNSAEAGWGAISVVSPDGVGGLGGEAWGGAIFAQQWNTAIDVTGSRFEENVALGGYGGEARDQGGAAGTARGGAIAVSTTSFGAPVIEMNIATSVFERNRAQGGNGGFVFDGDAGRGGDALGGAIFTPIGTLDLSHTWFLENVADAGRGGNATEGRAGHGGTAEGGAIYAGANVNLLIVGTLELEGPADDPEAITSTGLMLGNAALGGSGGIKTQTTEDANDDAGDGGIARGGAIAIHGGGLDVSFIMFMQNVAYGGNGGRGETFASSGAWGTPGGDNGDAQGGAIYTLAETTLVDSGFISNVAAGGRVDGDDDFGPFAAGVGGTNDESEGLDGGDGGFAFGGAVYVGTGASNDFTVLRTTFLSNQALGSVGGWGGPAILEDAPLEEGDRGGDGGQGGNAFGGAIYTLTLGEVTIHDALFAVNLVVAGRGGGGGRGADADAGAFDFGGTGGQGGNGGRGGNAGGGAIAIVNQIPSLPTVVDIRNTLIVANQLAAGDGGFGGNGGTGATFGGNAGLGGDGGNAIGGGIYLVGVDARIERTTIQENVISSGWGAAGGYGGSAGWVGGSGGPFVWFENGGPSGGDGGDALGGGIALLSGELVLVVSTIVQNEVYSGFGGNGGFGGFAWLGGASGGDGGDGGQARGGGVYHAGNAANLNLDHVTIAQNRLLAGGGGFAGQGGKIILTSDSPLAPSTYVRYEGSSQNPTPIVSGATAVFLPGFADEPTGSVFVLGLEQEVDLSSTNLGFDAVDANTLDIIGSASFAAAIPILAAGYEGGFLLASTAIVITSHTGIALEGAVAGASAISGVGAAATIFGAVGTGVAVLSIGAIVLTKAIVVGALSGDWEGAFEYALGAPGDVTARNLGVLLQGVQQNDDHDPPEPSGPGNNGNAGANGVADGTGIWGSTTLIRTLVANGRAAERHRELAGLSTQSENTMLFGEEITDVNRADVAGGVFVSSGGSNALNMIGAVDAGFAGEPHGTTASPLDARLDSQTGWHGGTTPTLRLLPLSPARGLPQTSSFHSSQNNFEWTSFYDIGAWGGVPNQAVTAVDDSFTIQAGQVLNFALAELLVNDIDPDDDPLRVANDVINGQPENGTVEVITVIVDPNEPPVTSIAYTPDPGFVGTETFTYVVTDDEFFDTGTITINVVPLLVGDYNRNNVVDAADYTVWRDTLGQAVLSPFSGADGNGNGMIDPDDYQAWTSNFGATLPVAAASGGGAALTFTSPTVAVDEALAAPDVVSSVVAVPVHATSAPAESASVPVEARADADFSRFAAGLARRDAAVPRGKPVTTARAAQPSAERMLLLLATDRITRSVTPSVIEVGQRPSDGHDEDRSDGPLQVDESLVAALAKW